MRVVGCAAVMSAGLCSELATGSSAGASGKSALGAGGSKLGAGGKGSAKAGSNCPLGAGASVGAISGTCPTALSKGGGGSCSGGAGGGLEAEA